MSDATAREPGPRPPLQLAAALASARQTRARAGILVEGWSDRAALEAAALRLGAALHAEGILVLPIGGATNLAAFASAFGPQGLMLDLAGLYDRAEEALALSHLARSGVVSERTREAAQAAGFFRCDADLEDELIRALGPARVLRVLEAQGEAAAWRRFQDQPHQRGREPAAQLRRFIGTRAGRKVRYGTLLVQALAPGEIPRPLREVLASVRQSP